MNGTETAAGQIVYRNYQGQVVTGTVVGLADDLGIQWDIPGSPVSRDFIKAYSTQAAAEAAIALRVANQTTARQEREAEHRLRMRAKYGRCSAAERRVRRFENDGEPDWAINVG